MKRTLLSLVTISVISTTGVLADSTTDIAELKSMMMEMNKRLAKLEAENKQLKAAVKKKSTMHTASAKKTTTKARKPVHYSKSTQSAKIAALEEKVDKLETQESKEVPTFAKASKLKFSGTHYLGYTHLEQTKDAVRLPGGASAPSSKVTSDFFATRRNYLQVKAYLFEDPKSYMRITLDTHQVANIKDTKLPNAGDWEVRLKYAYLYINDILPYTGVEFGQAHRPWIDYEEHHGWYYRSIAKTFVESKSDADFTNSADLGINFKTKTKYFSSEIGLFNGEGYHGVLDNKDNNNGLSFEWRLTGNLLGTGEKHVHKSDRYADVSFYGQYNNNYDKKGEIDPVTLEAGDFVWYGINAVYNQPEFLVNFNYIKSTKASIDYKGDGFSVNGELRLLTFDETLNDWNLIARYDKWNLDAYDKARESWLAGIAYTWNKNVEFIVNYLDEKDPRIVLNDAEEIIHQPTESKSVMFTADVKW